MFDLTTSPEFLVWLEKTMLVAADRMGRAGLGKGTDPEHDWLTPREAQGFVRLGPAAFKRFRVKHKNDIVTTTAVGDAEVRYQRAALQKIMLKSAVDLPEPEPAAKKPLNGNGHGNGKHSKAAAKTADLQFSEPLLIK